MAWPSNPAFRPQRPAIFTGRAAIGSFTAMNDMADLGGLGQQRRPTDGLVLRAQEEERRRIARDLHDSTSQLLVGLQFGIGQLKGAPLSDSFRAVLGDCETALSSIQREIRTLSYLCHPPLLGNQDLGAVLEAMTRGVAQRAGLSVRIDLEEIGEIEPAAEAAFYRLTQEALANICRHAKASRIGLRLAGRKKYVHLVVQDDGIGFDAASPVSPSGVGIAGMKERIAQMGGRLSIRRLGCGTAILASLPRQRPNRFGRLIDESKAIRRALAHAGRRSGAVG